jgi:hypothetical protein
MRNRQRTIRLSIPEHEVLKRLYLEKRLGRDRYGQFPKELRDITDRFNGLTGRNDTTSEILHYVRTKAKRGLMGTHGDDWRRMPQVPLDLLSEKEREQLLAIRRGLKVAEDNIAHDPKIAREYERRFLTATGRRLSAHALATYLMQLRKEGVLEKLDQRHEKLGTPFSDIDEISMD